MTWCGENFIVVDRRAGGGRLKYFREADTDPAYWDRLWADMERPHRYKRAMKGHIPRFLRGPIRRYVPPGGRVLEAGCGLADLTVALAVRGYVAEGCDYAPETVARLNSRFPQTRIFLADVRHMPEVPAETYDAIYSPGVVEHFETGPEAILAEARRLLKPAGVLLLSTPCLNGFRKHLARKGAFGSSGVEGLHFYQYAFSDEEMRRILCALGYEVLSTTYYGAIRTLRDHTILGRVPLGLLDRPLSILLDRLPVTRKWGHACLWVARKAPGTAEGE